MTNKRPHIEEEWWRDDQIELANDSTRIWKSTVFTCQPGYSIPVAGGRFLTRLLPGEAVPEGGTLEPNAWDHEHCALCWNKIMEKGGDFNWGYTHEKDWLCPECYDQYIAPQINKT